MRRSEIYIALGFIFGLLALAGAFVYSPGGTADAPIYIHTEGEGGGLDHVNLSASESAGSVTIQSDAGDDATIPGASHTRAGVMTASDKATLDLLDANDHDHHATTTPLYFDTAGNTATMAGDGSSTTPYRVKNPFTDADEVALVAAANPANILRFSVLDGDWNDNDDVPPGLMGLFESGGERLSSGDSLSSTTKIVLPRKAAIYGQQIDNPDTDLDAVDLHLFFGDLDYDGNGGNAILIFQIRGDMSKVAIVQADRVDSRADRYELTSLNWFYPFILVSVGRNWNVAAGKTGMVATDSIVDPANLQADWDATDASSAAFIKNKPDVLPPETLFNVRLARKFVSGNLSSTTGEAFVSSDNTVPSGAPSGVTDFVVVDKDAANGTDETALLEKVNIGDWIYAYQGDDFIRAEIQHINPVHDQYAYEFWFNPSADDAKTEQFDELSAGEGGVWFKTLGLTEEELDADYARLDGSNLTPHFRSEVQLDNETYNLGTLWRRAYSSVASDNEYGFNAVPVAKGASVNLNIRLPQDKYDETLKRWSVKNWIEFGPGVFRITGQLAELGNRTLSANVQFISGSLVAIDSNNTTNFIYGNDVHRGELGILAFSDAYGLALPGSCVVGDLFLLTKTYSSNTAGLYLCLTANSWTRQ